MPLLKRKYNLSLTELQKRALFKLAVDVVKIDNQIHRDEVLLLNELQQLCGFTGKSLDLIHYMSMQQALDVLKNLNSSEKESLFSILESAIGVDNNIDTRENILLVAIRMALRDKTKDWNCVVSVLANGEKSSSKQIVYIEKQRCVEVHSVLDDKYDNLLLTNILKDVGLQLFYLPDVVNELKEHYLSAEQNNSRYDLLRLSMEFIVPSGDRSKIKNLSKLLDQIDSEILYKIITTKYSKLPELVKYNAFLMLKIQDSYILNDDDELVSVEDFLCIDIGEDVKKRIIALISEVESPVSLISYEGYYKMLYNYLSSESMIMSSIVIDSKFDFLLVDFDNEKVKFESAPQSKTLYLLFLKYGSEGISQTLFESALDYLHCLNIDEFKSNGNWSVEKFKRTLLHNNNDITKLIYNLMTIYDYISTKDAAEENFLNYISAIIRNRRSLKNYINNGFSNIHYLANKELYCIQYNQQSKVYYLLLNSLFVKIDAGADNSLKIISECDLWKRLV